MSTLCLLHTKLVLPIAQGTRTRVDTGTFYVVHVLHYARNYRVCKALLAIPMYTQHICKSGDAAPLYSYEYCSSLYRPIATRHMGQGSIPVQIVQTKVQTRLGPGRT